MIVTGLNTSHTVSQFSTCLVITAPRHKISNIVIISNGIREKSLSKKGEENWRLNIFFLNGFEKEVLKT